MSIIERALDKLDSGGRKRDKDTETSAVERYANSLDSEDWSAEPEFTDDLGDSLSPDPAGASPGDADSVPVSKTFTLDRDAMARHGIMCSAEGSGQLVEEFRLIKRRLLNAQQQSAPVARDIIDRSNVIMVTSATAGEGKSYVGLNLAMSMAQEFDRTVLFIDADVATAKASRTLGLSDKPGISELLRGGATSIPDVMLRTDEDKLTVIPAGERPSNISELFSSQKMLALTNELAKRYGDRVIIVDSPPVLASSQTMAMSHLAGQVVVVVEAEATTRDDVEEAIDHLRGCREIFVLLNKDRSRRASRYGYY